ncbi:MAG: hypothetical protein F6K08_02885 [Okeania sp. SIO1H6]|uniref:hypothetical protein n=1 Tax=Dapis sp. BLCC M229 TaxID=3400188 RepID=UPI0013C6BB7F|nr:hypothetical protein [Okeania sp. SIO1H6]
MRNWNTLKDRYLRDEIPIRLGNLASNLARIKSRCQSTANQELVENLLKESEFFIEWTAPDTEVEVAAELVDLQIILARWQYNWESIWNDSELRSEVSHKANFWSEKLLNMSGLLTEN